MTLEQIAAACGGTYYGSEADKKRSAAGVVTDSRLVEKDFLFVPIKGARVDGHSFIPEVFFSLQREGNVQTAIASFPRSFPMVRQG